MLRTCPNCDNLEFDIFVVGGPQCHFITSVTLQSGFERVQELALANLVC